MSSNKIMLDEVRTNMSLSGIVGLECSEWSVERGAGSEVRKPVTRPSHSGQRQRYLRIGCVARGSGGTKRISAGAVTATSTVPGSPEICLAE